jgi:hypothetical protein
MLCIIDLCGDEETVLVIDEEEQAPTTQPPIYFPIPSLQIVPVETDEN